MIILEVKNLRTVINNQLILDNINFKVKEGEILAIIGPNGAGKTTLIKAILGLVPYQGEVIYKGDSVRNKLSEISYIPQKFDFDKNFPLTVEEFLGKTHLDNQIIKDVGILNILNKKLGELSGGQIQRLLIAKSLFKKPKLILMDEPTTGIDIKGEKKIYELITHLNEVYKITIIFVTHEINIVYNFANKVLCLNVRPLCYGEVKKEINEKNLKKLYGNNFAYQLHQHES